jgi:CHAT domain-containing protein
MPALLLMSFSESCGSADPQPLPAPPTAAGERLLNAGIDKSTAGDLPGAEKDLADALTAFRTAGDRRGEARALKELGGIAFWTGKPTEADSLYRQGLAAARAAGDRDVEARLLNNLALIIKADGRLDEARGLFAQSLEIAEEDRNEPVMALALTGQADLDRESGDLSAALSRLERAAEIARRLGPPTVTARVLTTLAQVYDARGDTKQAVLCWREALAAAQASGLQAGEMATWLGLGQELKKAGQADEAVMALQKSFDLARVLKDPEAESAAAQALAFLENGSEVEMIALAGAMWSHDRAEEWSAAADDAEKLLAKASAAGNDLYIGLALKELSAVALAQGEAVAAVERLEQSVAAFERAGEAGEAERANALLSLAAARFMGDDIAGALTAFHAMAESCRKTQDRKNEALAIQLEALMTFVQGDRPASEKLLRAALSLGRDLHDRELELQALFALGAMAWDSEPRSAREFFEKYLALIHEPGITLQKEDALHEAIVQGLLARVAANLDQGDRALQLADTAVATADAIGGGFDQALARDHRAYVHFRAGRLQKAESEATAAIDRFEREEAKLGDAELIRVGALDQKATLPDLLQQVLVREGKPAAALAAAERRRARVFSETLAGKAAPAPTVESLAQAVRRLDVTVIEYSILYDPGALLLPTRLQGLQAELETELYIWVVRPDGEVALRTVDLTALRKAGESLSGKVRYLLDRLESRRSTAADLQPLLRDLHGLLIAPVADLLPPDVPVVVVPQGPLFLVPFAALSDAAGRPMILRNPLITVPSIAVLADLRRPGSPEAWRGAAALVVGNPRTGSLPPLLNAEHEAQAVAAAFGTGALTGEAATEPAVLSALPQARLVHFATHGLAARGGSRLVPGALALAPARAGDDGLLTATEIRSLHLIADLVVLSACRTARGRLSGDGVIGLARSFLAAGAAGAITSLWQIDDEATSALMADFYAQLTSSGDPAGALRQAQLDAVKRGDSPRVWGAFTYLGAPSAAGSPGSGARRAAHRSGDRF